jgi:cytoskeletal protein RodZ
MPRWGRVGDNADPPPFRAAFRITPSGADNGRMLGRQRLVKVLSAVIVSLLSGGAAWGVTASTASPHGSSASTEVDSSTSSSIDETSSTEASTTTTEDSTTTTEASTTTTVAEDTTTPLEPTTPVTGECNHGADVSWVAHEAPRGDGNEHGKAVSDAAHQKCDQADKTTEADEHDDAPENDGEHGS